MEEHVCYLREREWSLRSVVSSQLDGGDARGQSSIGAFERLRG